MKKYNRADIMKRAWEIRKARNITMAEAMRLSWAEAKEGKQTTKEESAKEALDIAAQSLFRVRAMLDKLAAEETALMDQIKAAITESGEDHISGFGWKVSWQTVNSKRLDSKALKADHADLYAAYSKPQTCKRFLFGAV